MKSRPSPEAAVAFVKASVFLICSWPPRTGANKFRVLLFRAQWWIVLILLLLLFLPLLNGVWDFRHDPVIAVKAILMSSATAQALMKTLVCRYQRERLQRCSKFHGFVTVCVYLACLGFIVEPLLLSQPFPTDSSFPFPVESHPLYEIIYMQQAITIFHVAAALSIDSQVAMLVWYTAARFEMLGEEFENSKNHYDLARCVVKHRELLTFAKNVTEATRLVALATITTTTIGIICGGLTLISDQPFSVMLRVGNMVFNASVELFVYAWPADNLIEASRAIGMRAYNSGWLGKSIGMQKNLLYVIQRSEKPVTLSVGGFLPALSLNYYATFLSSALSYFSTLRIIYNGDG